MQVVWLQEEAFYTLFDKVVEHVESKRVEQLRKCIDGDEAMSILNISSKTTLKN